MNDGFRLGAADAAPHDEGGLQMAVGHDENGKVFLNFGKQIAWIGMDPDEALRLAIVIIEHAFQAKRP